MNRRSMGPNNHQKHQAGRHLAVAEALLHGYAASIQGAQTHILVNGQTAAVMVATKGAWMIEHVDKFTNSTTETYVLVDLTRGRRDFYVVPGGVLRREVAERHQAFLDRVGGVRPRNPKSKHSAVEPQHVVRWAADWSRFDRQGEASEATQLSSDA
jgi:hypothetical protein